MNYCAIFENILIFRDVSEKYLRVCCTVYKYPSTDISMKKFSNYCPHIEKLEYKRKVGFMDSVTSFFSYAFPTSYLRIY